MLWCLCGTIWQWNGVNIRDLNIVQEIKHYFNIFIKENNSLFIVMMWLWNSRLIVKRWMERRGRKREFILVGWSKYQMSQKIEMRWCRLIKLQFIGQLCILFIGWQYIYMYIYRNINPMPITSNWYYQIQYERGAIYGQISFRDSTYWWWWKNGVFLIIYILTPLISLNLAHSCCILRF